MNQVKSRLQNLGLLDRAFANVSDDDLATVLGALGEDHREAIDELVGGEADASGIRAALPKGRLDGTMESIALVLTDACLADCIEALGDDADRPTTDQLREATPALIKAHGLGITQLMLASTVAGEAPASAIIRDLLKNDDELKLPPATDRPISPIVQGTKVSDEERAAIKAKRQQLKQKKQEAARKSRQQAARAKHR